jgi:haloacetate dehalogenase
MFEGFEARRIEGAGAEIFCRVGGAGPALLLLHGYPQTHVMWHRCAARLAERFTLVCADLRGYGDSSRPPTDTEHTPYSKRAMAADMAAVMAALGHERFFVGAHDRGARVAHRLALDHADRVRAMVLLDIAPTREMYRDADSAFATAYWHWYLLIQKAPFPETLIGHDPDAYWLKKCGSGSAGLKPFSDEALAEYLRCWRDPAVIHASCEDYRAAATIDIRHDDEDAGRKVACPLRVLWGRTGAIERCFDALALWRERADHVEGGPLEGGHYLAEELPDAVCDQFIAFFGRHGCA